MDQTVWIRGGCNSWYLDDQGRNGTLYPGFASTFRRSLRELHAQEYDFAAPVALPSRGTELVGAGA
jgi:hypothetical protein